MAERRVRGKPGRDQGTAAESQFAKSWHRSSNRSLTNEEAGKSNRNQRQQPSTANEWEVHLLQAGRGGWFSVLWRRRRYRT
jgi:hypothetical protein